MYIQSVIAPLKRMATGPAAKGIYRVGKSLVPLAGAFAGGVALYSYCPAVQESVNNFRAFLAPHPRTSELITSAITLGLIPDFMAQRYEGRPMNYGRLAGMTALGSFMGAYVIREFYGFAHWLFPEQTFRDTVSKIILDQFIFTPPALSFYFMVTDRIQRKPWAGFSPVFKKVWKTLPINWAFWILPVAVIHNLPADLKVYVFNSFSLIWFSILSKIAHEKTKTV